MDDRRYYGLDALRGFMMMLGIVFHAAMLYQHSPPPAMPMPTDRNNSLVFDFIFEFVHDFRMPTFFLLAGFFAALLVERRGIAGTWRNRAARILAPLLAALVLILPITGLLMFDFMLSARNGTHDFIPDIDALKALGAEVAAKKGIPANQPMTGHLWFLYYLCMFYILLPACAWLTARSRGAAVSIERWQANPLTLLPLTLWTAMTLWPFHGGQVHEGFIYFRPHGPSLLYYGSFFVLGYLVHAHRTFLDVATRLVPMTGALSPLMFALAAYASGLDNAAGGADFTLHGFSVLANGLATWVLLVFFVGAALRFFDRPSPWIIYIAQSSYWVFLIHMPLVCLAGWWLVPFDLPAAVKFLLVCSFTTVLAFLTFHYGVQNTWVSSFLHGKRFDLPWPWQAARKTDSAP